MARLLLLAAVLNVAFAVPEVRHARALDRAGGRVGGESAQATGALSFVDLLGKEDEIPVRVGEFLMWVVSYEDPDGVMGNSVAGNILAKRKGGSGRLAENYRSLVSENCGDDFKDPKHGTKDLCEKMVGACVAKKGEVRRPKCTLAEAVAIDSSFPARATWLTSFDDIKLTSAEWAEDDYLAANVTRGLREYLLLHLAAVREAIETVFTPPTWKEERDPQPVAPAFKTLKSQKKGDALDSLRAAAADVWRALMAGLDALAESISQQDRHWWSFHYDDARTDVIDMASLWGAGDHSTFTGLKDLARLAKAAADALVEAEKKVTSTATAVGKASAKAGTYSAAIQAFANAAYDRESLLLLRRRLCGDGDGVFFGGKFCGGSAYKKGEVPAWWARVTGVVNFLLQHDYSFGVCVCPPTFTGDTKSACNYNKPPGSGCSKTDGHAFIKALKDVPASSLSSAAAVQVDKNKTTALLKELASTGSSPPATPALLEKTFPLVKALLPAA